MGIELVWHLNDFHWRRKKTKQEMAPPYEVLPRVKAELLKVSPGALEAVEDMVSLGTEFQPWPKYLSIFIPKDGPLRPIPAVIKPHRRHTTEAGPADWEGALRAEFMQRTQAFPGVKVVGRFSRVGFNSSKNIAAVDVTWISLLDTGAPFYRGSLLILRLEGNVWKLEKALLDWVS